MKKNVAGQFIGAQLVDAATGAPFTGAVTCYVTGDNGAQAVGSVGAGACTHKGNGTHNYAPSQAETNYDYIEFTFIATGAVSAMRDVRTIGSSDLASILARLPATLVGGRMDSIASVVAVDALSASSLAADAVAEIKAAVVAALSTDTYAEPAAALGANASLVAAVMWLLAESRNKQFESSTLWRLRNFGDTADIASRSVAFDVPTTTLTKGKVV